MKIDALQESSQIPEPIRSVLFHIQENIEFDLDLNALSEVADLSPFHFHRNFRTVVGETPKQYIQRLRLERSAYLLNILDSTVLDVAIASGYKNHETFSRAFKRHFSVAPTEYRTLEKKKRIKAPVAKPPPSREWSSNSGQIQVQKLNPIPVAFIRIVGSYWEIPDPTTPEDRAWNKLIAWAIEHRIYQKNLLIGITHDDPQTTPLEKLRTDACLQIPLDFPVPSRRFRYQVIEGGYYAVIRHFGSFDGIDQSYALLVSQARNLKNYRLRYAPTFQVYRSTNVNKDFSLYQTDIYLPLEQ